MNKFEKDILESELGLNTLAIKDIAPDDEDREPSDDAFADCLTEGSVDGETDRSESIDEIDDYAEQLKIDDALLNSVKK